MAHIDMIFKSLPHKLRHGFIDIATMIIAEVKNIVSPMLTRVWQELEYRVDVCRVTCGAHIEHL
jgi:hypothetical protein